MNNVLDLYEDEVIEVYRRFGIAVRFKNDELFDSRVEMRMEEEL